MSSVNLNILYCIMWLAASFNVVVFAWIVGITICCVRNYRVSQLVRVQTFAYEKELAERGVTLPSRCVTCCQVLPAHVAGCMMEDFYKKYDWIMEPLTRPSIKYLRLNEPADLVH